MTQNEEKYGPKIAGCGSVRNARAKETRQALLSFSICKQDLPNLHTLLTSIWRVRMMGVNVKEKKRDDEQRMRPMSAA